MSAQWKLNGIFKANAEIVDEEIKSLSKITPNNMVEFAKNNPDSELYKCFEWDDTIAAQKYRLQQANKILTFLVYPKTREDLPTVRKYQVTTTAHVFEETKKFLVNQNEYETLLKRALAELQAFKQRYQTLVELQDVISAIDTL